MGRAPRTGISQGPQNPTSAVEGPHVPSGTNSLLEELAKSLREGDTEQMEKDQQFQLKEPSRLHLEETIAKDDQQAAMTEKKCNDGDDDGAGSAATEPIDDPDEGSDAGVELQETRTTTGRRRPQSGMGTSSGSIHEAEESDERGRDADAENPKDPSGEISQENAEGMGPNSSYEPQDPTEMESLMRLRMQKKRRSTTSAGLSIPGPFAAMMELTGIQTSTGVQRGRAPMQVNPITADNSKSELTRLSEMFQACFGHLSPSGGPTRMRLNDIVEALGVPRRRMYDVINVLESLEVMRRIGRLEYEFRGYDHLPDFLSLLMDEKDVVGWTETGSAKSPKCGVAASNAVGSGASGRARRGSDLEKKSAAKNGDMPAEEYVLVEKEVSSTSLWFLTRQLIRILLRKSEPVSLVSAATEFVETHKSVKPVSNSRSQTQITVERRLYDIGSILCSIGLVKRVYVQKRQPSFKWIYGWRPGESHPPPELPVAILSRQPAPPAFFISACREEIRRSKRRRRTSDGAGDDGNEESADLASLFPLERHRRDAHDREQVPLHDMGSMQFFPPGMYPPVHHSAPLGAAGMLPNYSVPQMLLETAIPLMQDRRIASNLRDDNNDRNGQEPGPIPNQARPLFPSGRMTHQGSPSGIPYPHISSGWPHILMNPLMHSNQQPPGHTFCEGGGRSEDKEVERLMPYGRFPSGGVPLFPSMHHAFPPDGYFPAVSTQSLGNMNHIRQASVPEDPSIRTGWSASTALLHMHPQTYGGIAPVPVSVASQGMQSSFGDMYGNNDGSNGKRN